MPQFVKMGLNGTGYIGKKGSYSRSVQQCKARRMVLPGFPITTPFESIKDVREYLSGDRMICLLCGKSYKRIGTHLTQIHGVTVDDYKKKYNIPWGYGLICKESSEKYSKAVKKRMDEGWVPPFATGDNLKKLISVEKRKCPFKGEVATLNLGSHGKPVHPLTQAPDGTLEPHTQKRKRLRTKKGTKEYKEKMRQRPQCQPEAVIERGFNKYWSGKKQSEEHKQKRLKKATKKAVVGTKCL